MQTRRKAALLCVLLLFAGFAADNAFGDWIKFKKGGAQRCVVVEESKDEVVFLTSMGEAKMPMERVSSIKRESEEVNDSLREQWGKKKHAPEPKPEPVEPEPAEPEEPTPLHTYKTLVTKSTIALGGKMSGVEGGQPVADFVIDDLGEIEKNRVFEVRIISYRSGMRKITSSDFHVTLSNGYRVDAKSMEEYPALNLTLRAYDKGSGYLTFPTTGALKTLVLRSSIADFDLDLETGEFAIKQGPF